MKQLTCEMCGSTDLLKQDGVFVCQTCGTKYSVEEAKKMMIEGIVEVHGTVKVDNSASVERYLTNARRARQKEDWEETEKYYNMVEQNAPENIEAIFYSAYAKAKLSLVETDLMKRKHNFEVLGKSISIIDDCYDKNNSTQMETIINKISEEIVSLSQTTFGFISPESVYPLDPIASTHIYIMIAETYLIETLEEIIIKDEKEYLYHLLIKHYGRCLTSKYLKHVERLRNKELYSVFQSKMGETNQKIKQLNPSYQESEIPQKSGCYVATCVYGSYDCPEVWALRRFRDNTLGSTWYGRSFIRTYYAISPTLVKWFGHTKWFKRMWRGTLDHMVSKLQSKGVESTPYNDKEWGWK